MLSPDSIAPSQEIAAKPRIVQLREFEFADVAASDVLVGDRLRIYPNLAKKGYFEVTVRPAGIRLQAKGYVGIIPINDRLTLEVGPRVPVANLARLMEVSGEAPIAIADALRLYETGDEMYPSLVATYAAGLRSNVEEVVTRGLYREYERIEEVTAFPSGRLNVNRTIQQAARGIEHRVATARFLRSADNAVNRCLLFAVWRLNLYLDQLGRLSKSQRVQALADLNLAYKLLPGVELDWSESFLEDGMVVGKQLLPSSRAYYRPPLDLALAVIGRDAVLIDRAGTHLRLPSMVVNMSDVFESYLRKILRRVAKAQDWRCAVLDGNTKPPAGGRGRVFDSADGYPATPDIVLQLPAVALGDGSAAIVEVKYKPSKGSVERGDLNQAISYGASYRAKHVVLAQPRASDARVSKGMRLLGTVDEMSVYQYLFDAGAADLCVEEQNWSSAMEHLVA